MSSFDQTAFLSNAIGMGRRWRERVIVRRTREGTREAGATWRSDNDEDGSGADEGDDNRQRMSVG